MDQTIKLKISLYGIISSFTFVYLIMDNSLGISISLFFIIQFLVLYLSIKNFESVNTKGFYIMIPIFIISLHYFIRAIYIPANFFVMVVLYSMMFLILGNKLSLIQLNSLGILKIIINIFEPIINFTIPFRWIAENSTNKERNILLKRISIGVIITIPPLMFLIVMLSSADLVFYNNFNLFYNWSKNLFVFINIFKILSGIFTGLYLFGHLYHVFMEDKLENISGNSFHKIKGDVIILNILLFSILFVYTIFIAIQFKYLFSGGNLPNNLNYSEYARRGFFELVFLSVLNIALIIFTTYLLRDKIYRQKNKWAILTKLMLIYLCAVTLILLISSYYRMSLYDNAYGFTRLRVLVYIFLIFETLGLLATFMYIIKHNFNLFTVYAVIGLTFYLTLNIVNIDGIIAKRNIDMYLSGQAENIDIDYLMILSPDAIPQIVRLTDTNVQIMTRIKIINYLDNIKESYIFSENNWRSYNLSIQKSKKLLKGQAEVFHNTNN